MDLRDCFKYFAGRQGDGVVITSAGVTSGTWWRTTHDMDRAFYLGASMSMISMFGAGIAMGAPKLPGVGVYGRRSFRDESGHADG